MTNYTKFQNSFNKLWLTGRIPEAATILVTVSGHKFEPPYVVIGFLKGDQFCDVNTGESIVPKSRIVAWMPAFPYQPLIKQGLGNG